MELNALINKLNNIRNGQFFKIRYATELPVYAASRRAGITCFKITQATVRKGIKYGNQRAVIIKVEKGELTLPHELPWGEWHPEHKGLFITHKTKNYLRVYPSPNKPKTTYFLNGEEVSYETVKASGHIQKSYFDKASSKKPDCFNLKVESILGIG